MITKSKNYIFVFLILSMILSGCYRNKQVQSYEVGLALDDGVSISKVLGPGRYSSGGWWADLVTVNGSNITVTWTDPSLVTSDKQPIGLTLSVTFARKRDSESISALYTQYNSEATNDETLKNLVTSKIPGVAKTITTRYTLDQMLGIAEGGDRQAVTEAITELLQREFDQIFVQLTSVEIADIAPDTGYLAALNAKAQAQINIEVAQQQTKLITEQLEQEKAQTNIELEKARRENQVNQEKAKAYEESPELLQLRMLELTADMLDKGDVIIYVPEGTSITSVLTQQSAPVIPSN